jgi:hypothetical protein
LELGQQLSETSLRTTEFAPALEAESPPTDEPKPGEAPTPPVIYGPPQWARPSFTGGFPGSAFTPQPDGTLRCPANHPLYPQERRPERNGSLRVLYAARIGHCSTCPLRAQCQESSMAIKPRRVSAVFWPLESSPPELSRAYADAPDVPPRTPVLWKDWPRCALRRRWLKVVRSETVSLTESFTTSTPSSITVPSEAVLTRAERAQWRLSWEQRLTRNTRPPDAPRLFVTLYGLPVTFAHAFGFELLATA